MIILISGGGSKVVAQTTVRIIQAEVSSEYIKYIILFQECK
jgi:hypothetical protein